MLFPWKSLAITFLPDLTRIRNEDDGPQAGEVSGICPSDIGRAKLWIGGVMEVVELVALQRLPHALTCSRVSIELFVRLDRSRSQGISTLDLTVFNLFILAEVQKRGLER